MDLIIPLLQRQLQYGMGRQRSYYPLLAVVQLEMYAVKLHWSLLISSEV